MPTGTRAYTREFMDRLEVMQGRGKSRRGVKLNKHAAGRRILGWGPEMETGQRTIGEGKRAEKLWPPEIVDRMLTYLIGTAPAKRIPEIPWRTIDEYLEGIAQLRAEDESYAVLIPYEGNRPQGAMAVEELLELARLETDEELAREIVDWQTSQTMWSLFRRLQAIAAPRAFAESDTHQRGALDRSQARQVRKCIPKDDMAVIKRRMHVIRGWAEHPETIPEWSCVPDAQMGLVMQCTTPAVIEDVRRVENACQAAYDPSWTDSPASWANEGNGYEDAAGALMRPSDVAWTDTGAPGEDWDPEEIPF